MTGREWWIGFFLSDGSDYWEVSVFKEMDVWLIMAVWPLLSRLRPVISFLGSLSLCACVFAFPAYVVSSLVNAGHRYWSHLDSILCITYGGDNFLYKWANKKIILWNLSWLHFFRVCLICKSKKKKYKKNLVQGMYKSGCIQ